MDKKIIEEELEAIDKRSIELSNRFKKSSKKKYHCIDLVVWDDETVIIVPSSKMDKLCFCNRCIYNGKNSDECYDCVETGNKYVYFDDK